MIEPPAVFVSNRQLAPIPQDIEGLPHPGYIPTDTTLLGLYHVTMDPGMDVSEAIPLKGITMNFSDLGGGDMGWGFRQFRGWWTATANGTIYSLQIFLWIGQNAGPEWSQVQPIVNSIRLP